MDVYKVCPMAHIPRLYGECPACRDWYVLRRDGRLKAHTECSVYRDHDARGRRKIANPYSLKPLALALLCVECRHLPSRKAFAGTVQIFSIGPNGLQVVAA